MKITDGYCDYSWEKELTTLMTRMADLSKYTPVLVDAITLNPKERESFEKTQEDYYLFEAGLLFIFSERVYVERISAAFKNLTFKQRSNFYAYYKSYRDLALRHGFLSDYDSILQMLSSGWETLARVAIWGCLFLYTYNVTDSFFITLLITSTLSLLHDIHSKVEGIATSMQQADFIIQKLNITLIKENFEWAKNRLIKAGWLDNEGNLKETSR